MLWVTQSCLSFWDTMDCSPPGSSVRGILQARIVDWVAMPSSRGSSQPRDQTQVSCTASRFFTNWATGEVPFNLNYLLKILYLNMITLGLIASTYEFWGTQFNPQESLTLSCYTARLPVFVKLSCWILMSNIWKGILWLLLLKIATTTRNKFYMITG